MLMGKQSIDGDNSQTGPMLAGLLDWSEASYISSLSIMNPDVLKVEEETETGRRTLEVHLPAVITKRCESFDELRQRSVIYNVWNESDR